MKIQILLFLFVLTLLITDDVSAGRGGSRGGGSRGGGSRGGGHGSSRGSSWGSSKSSSSTSGHKSTSDAHTVESGSSRSSSSGHTTGSRLPGYDSSSGGHMTRSSRIGSSSGEHMTGSSRIGSSSGEHITRSSPTETLWGRHMTGLGTIGRSSGEHMTGSSPIETLFGRDMTGLDTIGSSKHMTGSSPIEPLFGTHMLGLDTTGISLREYMTGPSPIETLFGRHMTGSDSFGISLREYMTGPSPIETLWGSHMTELNPIESSLGGHITGLSPIVSLSSGHMTGSSSAEHGISSGQTSHQQNKDSSTSFIHSEGGGATRPSPTSFDQPSAPFNPPHRAVPPNNPAGSNPNYNPSQTHPPGPVSTNVGFRSHLRPTSTPVPSHVPSAPYPHDSYSSSNFNQRPPYSVQPSDYQPHSTYNSSHSLPNLIGHPASYPAHVPPPVPGTFGNPYAMHPVSSANSSTGHSYYPQQQHMLAQPAAQPYIPGHTVIMVPGQQDSGRGFGQMVKEALVFSTINTGMNSVPTSNTSVVPPSPSQGGVSSPASYPSPVSIPTIVGNNGSVVNSTGGSSMGTTNSAGGSPAVAPNGYPAGNTTNVQTMSDQWVMPRYRISDGQLRRLTEELFEKQEFDLSKYLTLNLQSLARSSNVTDEAKGPLIHVQSDAYEYPTILAIRALYDNYEHNSTVKENRTIVKREEEDLLLDVFLNTNVMARAMKWLSNQGFVDLDDFERKDILRHIWFSQFDGSTSGFERVFTSERYGQDLLGVIDWIYFEYQESKNRIDYKGFVGILKLGNRASLVKLNFQMDDIIRPNATIFVGTLPELEMSLYTICFFARPNDLCPVSLGGKKFNIYTHSFRYYGKDLIDLALPIF